MRWASHRGELNNIYYTIVKQITPLPPDRTEYSVAEVAAARGVTRAAVNQDITAQKLPARRVGGSYVIATPDAEKYVNSPRRKGRRPGAKNVKNRIGIN